MGIHPANQVSTCCSRILETIEDKKVVIAESGTDGSCICRHGSERMQIRIRKEVPMDPVNRPQTLNCLSLLGDSLAVVSIFR